MKYAETQALLDAHLALVLDLPELQLENTQNVGKTGEPFARATLLTRESVRQSSMQTRYGGLYVIDLYYPQDMGVAELNGMADTLIEHFETTPLHRLQDGDLIVQLEKTWRETLGRREPHYAVQVKVRWHSLL